MISKAHIHTHNDSHIHTHKDSHINTHKDSDIIHKMTAYSIRITEAAIILIT